MFDVWVTTADKILVIHTIHWDPGTQGMNDEDIGTDTLVSFQSRSAEREQLMEGQCHPSTADGICN